MTTQAFSEILLFTRCTNWNSDKCPHLMMPSMQLTIINSRSYWLLDDKTVEELNRLCGECRSFIRKNNKF